MTGSRPGIIERAYQLADEGKSDEQIRTQLKREMYENVDAHLSSRVLRLELHARAAVAKANQGDCFAGETLGTHKLCKRWRGMSDEPKVEIALLTASQVTTLGSTLRDVWPIEDSSCFGSLLQAIDEARRDIWRQRDLNPEVK